jgi:2-polyprenyl-3-methyl-5-hydroxy-6-metoxy-1,4-benzoquinol methylase
MSSRDYEEDVIRSAKVDRVYSNQGNIPLLDLLNSDCRRILDIGCGAGNNALLIKSRNPDCDVYGITHSANEALSAQVSMKKCWVADIEGEIPDDLANQSFDVLVFSHVLEHLRDPAAVLERFSRLLTSGGQVLIAVPNILSWAMRLQFLTGDFEYQSCGVLDDTHLRYFTYFTADRYLLSRSPHLMVTHKTVSGSVPLWWLRRHILPRKLSELIDQWGCRHWPNLFGYQVLIRVVKI